MPSGVNGSGAIVLGRAALACVVQDRALRRLLSGVCRGRGDGEATQRCSRNR